MDIQKPTIIIYSASHISKELFLIDILLDETLTYGTVYIPTECFKMVSTINQRLPAKKEYELLLRMAEHFPIKTVSTMTTNSEHCHILSIREEETNENTLTTDCYILSRYKKILLNHSLFDAACESILAQATIHNLQDKLLPIMSEMLSEQKNYLYYDLGSAPFLIYTGDPVCYQVLDVFSRELGKSLSHQGQLVEYYDISKNDITDSALLIGRKFQAIIGIQTYMFSIRLAKTNEFLHDSIIGPKYNLVLDHPTRFNHHLLETPSHFTVLTADRNYAAFAKQYYSLNTRFLPPAGISSVHSAVQSRIYDVSFIASYNNISTDIFYTIHQLERNKRFFINRLWLFMRKKPSLSAEKLLSLTLSYYKQTLSDQEFLSLFISLKPYIFYIVNWFRSKVLETLLNAGISVHVFGTSWAYSPLRKHPCFIWHNQDLSTKECLNIWQQSKITLNVMSWHKDAITERILNSMLQKAVVITERNPYICEEFDDDKDIILYDLAHLDALPIRIKSLLSDANSCKQIAHNAYNKASSYHTWDNRALQLISFAELDTR